MELSSQKLHTECGCQCWRAASSVLCENKVPQKLNGKIYKSMIRPTMTYIRFRLLGYTPLIRRNCTWQKCVCLGGPAAWDRIQEQLYSWSLQYAFIGTTILWENQKTTQRGKCPRWRKLKRVTPQKQTSKNLESTIKNACDAEAWVKRRLRIVWHKIKTIDME